MNTPCPDGTGKPHAATPAFLQRPDRLVMLFACAVVLMLWAVIAGQIAADRRDALREWSGSQESLTRSFADHTARAIYAVDHDLRFIRNQYRDAGTVPDLPKLTGQEGLEATYRRIGILDRDGRYLASNRPWESSSQEDMAALRAQERESGDLAFISGPELRREGPGRSIHISRRMRTAAGGFDGIVLASIDPDNLGSMYADANLGEHGAAALLDLDGKVLALNNEELLRLGKRLPSRAFDAASRNRQSGSFIETTPTDGIKRLYTFYRLPEYPLTMVTAVTIGKIYERTSEAAMVQVAIAVGASLVTLLLARMIARLLRRLTGILRELRASQAQAESANKMKSEFLASMSHELRTPLNGILGFADIIRHKTAEDRTRRQAGMIHSSGRHLLELLNGILDLAKIEAGRMEVSPRQEELRPLLRGVADAHEEAARAKGLALGLEVAEDVPQFALCDGPLLRQVLHNLLNNAIKFTQAGAVTLRLARGVDGAATLHLEVRDTGIGIPADAQQLVFEKFRQADQSERRAHQGAGLGLALSKQLVELMGGHIGLQSRPGLGTTIWFELPMQAAAKAGAAAMQTPASATVS